MVKETGRVLSQERIAEGIFDLRIRVSFAEAVRPGQFLMIWTGDGSRLLGRPISICGADPEAGTLRLVYRTAGEGTKALSELSAGDEAEILGPLGNGFPVEEYREKRVLLVGGGIGIPPLVGTGRSLEKPAFALGYRSETYLLEDIREIGEALIATEDGSLGTKGNVLDALSENEKRPGPGPGPEKAGWLFGGLSPEAIFACGPMPMLRAAAAFANEREIPCFISMEERMACGVGACLGCVTRTREADEHSHVKNARICREGPVFNAKEVEL